jgi:GNAT superfamily N-acetyltransferase
MTVETATVADAEAILVLQKRAYQSEAAIYDDYTIPPLVQTLAEFVAELGRMVVLKACEGGEIRGSVRACVRDQTCFIGRVIVHPDHQGNGIGTLLMRTIEGLFPSVERFELFTGHRSTRNLGFYRMLGYRQVRKETVNQHLELVYLQKESEAGHDESKIDPCMTNTTRPI